MAIPDSFLAELRARTPMPALVQRRVKLQRSNRDWKGCCPFHSERSPSFYVYGLPEPHFHCFGCGDHGDAIAFVMKTQGLTFPDAVDTLAKEAGMEVPRDPAGQEVERRRNAVLAVLKATADTCQSALRANAGKAALDYLHGRGLTDETIERFGIGWVGREYAAGGDVALMNEAGLMQRGEDGAPGRPLFFNRIMFPIRDIRGRVISFTARTMGDGQPKYVNGPETAVFSKRRTVYGLDLARQAGAIAAVVEGTIDVAMLNQAGIVGAVAPLGTALTTEQMEAIWQISPSPALCFDGDNAGVKAMKRAIDLLLPHITPARSVRILRIPADEDPDSLIRKRGVEGMQEVLAKAKPMAEALFEMLQSDADGTTPEGRAALRNSLEEAAAKIHDRGLSTEYRRTLLGRLGENRQRQSLQLADAGEDLQARVLAATILRHPEILIDVEEAWARLDLPPDQHALRIAVLDLMGTADALTSASLMAALQSQGIDIEATLSEDWLPLPSCAAAETPRVHVVTDWWCIYAARTGSALDEEMQAAARGYADDPTDEAELQLCALAAARRAQSETASE